MIAIIRISGDVGLKGNIRETFHRLNLRKKYSCVVINLTNEKNGMLKKIKNFVAYGEIKKETFEKLVEKRAQLIDKTKKVDRKKIADEIEKGKEYKEVGLKPFFRLHPPRGGIDSKKHFGVNRGVLGNNKEHINKLIEKML